MYDSTRGYLYALGSAICAGAIPTLSKILLIDVKPLVISGLVFFLAGLVLLPYRPNQSPGRHGLVWMVTTGLTGAALAPALYFLGVDRTSAVNASLLTNTEVFFTVLIAVLVFNESLRRSQLLEGLLVVTGVLIVSSNLEPTRVQLLQGLTGNLLIIAASFVWAIDNNLSRITSQKFGPVFVSKFRNLIGGALLLAFVFASSGGVLVHADSIPVLLLLTGATMLSTLFFMAALVRIGAVRSLLVFASTSIFGSVFAVAVLQEAITPVQLVGGGLILSGVYLIQRSERPKMA